MKDLFDKIILGALVVALLLAALGLILINKVLTAIALSVLMAVSLAFGVAQVISYLKSMGTEDEKQQLILMIVSFVVCLAIIVVSILTFSGKIFNLF